MEIVKLPFLEYEDPLSFLEDDKNPETKRIHKELAEKWDAFKDESTESRGQWLTLLKQAEKDLDVGPHKSFTVSKDGEEQLSLEFRYASHSFIDIRFGAKRWSSVYAYHYNKKTNQLFIVVDKKYVGSEDLVLEGWILTEPPICKWKLESVGPEMIYHEGTIYVQKCNSIQRYYSIWEVNSTDGSAKQTCHTKRWDHVVKPVAVSGGKIWYIQSGRRFQNIWSYRFLDAKYTCEVSSETEPNILGFDYPYFWTDKIVYSLLIHKSVFATDKENIADVYPISNKGEFFVVYRTNMVVSLAYVKSFKAVKFFKPQTGGKIIRTASNEFLWFSPDRVPARLAIIKNKVDVEEKQPLVRSSFSVSENGLPPTLTLLPDGKAKGLLVYVYGYYGTSTPVYLQARWLAWVRAGYVVSFLGVSGGGDNGIEGWDSARSNRREKAFQEVLAAVPILQKKYSVPAKKTILYGRSAGGMTVANMLSHKKLFGAIWAEAPFVDVIKGCLNTQIPVAPLERDEFFNVGTYTGFREAMKFDPILNTPLDTGMVILATGGAHDSEVMPWEPVKWICRLSENGWNKIGCRIDQKTGHFMGTDDYALEKLSEDCAFLEDSILG